MKYQIAVIGDCVKDVFLQTDGNILKMPYSKKRYLGFPYGEKMTVRGVSYDLGGSACNAAVGIARLGIGTNFSSIIGDDGFGQDVIHALKKENIGAHHVVLAHDKPSYFSIILTGPDGDRTILTSKTEYNFNALALETFCDTAGAICVSGINSYSRALQNRIIRYIQKSNKPFFINPSSFQLKYNKTTLKKLIAHADIVSLNRDEAQLLCGKRRAMPKELLSAIRMLGADMILITEGDKGAYAYDGLHFYKIGIYPIKRKDSAGSGDAFFATFIAATMKGTSIETALRLASINAGMAASVYGAQKGLLAWPELMKRDKQRKVSIRLI